MIAFMTFALRRASKIRKHTLVDVLPEIPKTYGILKIGCCMDEIRVDEV
jgi:hypothetical protein